MAPKKYNFLSLFSGCGGFDLGFIKNGFECLGAYDIDPTVIKVYEKNIGEHIYNYDLSTGNLPNVSETVDVVLSGSPCQGFSTVGLRDLEDPRNSLLLAGGKIAIDHKAKVFVAENVMGSLSGKHRVYWDRLIQYLENNGYKTELTVCEAHKIGLAQTRRRVILYAWKGNGKVALTYHSATPKTLRDVITNINGAPNKEFQSLGGADDLLIANSIRPGKKLCDVRGGERAVHSWDIPKVFGHCTDKEKELLLLIQKLRRKIRRRDFGDSDPVNREILTEFYSEEELKRLLESLIQKNYLVEKEPNHYDLKRSFNGKYRRLDFDSPSYTIDTNFGNPKYFLHPEENRGISVREAARIQGFDDKFEFSGGLKDQFKMIGNAVPPPMALEISRNVAKLLALKHEG